ncbi:hypothetical protein [Cellulosimicrobium cellulans]|uniref:hypothetical protein n=1 Tax=Cellulosimicrobium cellulans TaxID=1710 RepID=UPI000849592A|nr:hypothetical protein [Cellulosimicrobium cellulans]
MLSHVAGPLRLARAALVATLVLALSAGAHAVAGGHLPDPLVLVALGAFTLAGTMVAARGRFTVPRLVALLGGAQLALHVALDTLGHGSAACAAGASAAAHTAHGVALACATSSPVPDGAGSGAWEGLTPAGLEPVGAAAAAPGAWMVAAHAVATLVLAVVLAHGERALERLLAWLTPRPATPARVVLPVRRTPVLVVVSRRLESRYLGTAPTRGPPAAVPLVGTPA